MPLVLPSTLCDTLRRAVAETPGEKKKPSARRKLAAKKTPTPAAKKTPTPRKGAKGKTPRPRAVLSKEQMVERTREIVKLRLLFPSWTFEQIAEKVTATVPAWKITGAGAHAAWQRHLDEQTEDLATVRDGDTSALVQEHLEGLRMLREFASTILLESSQGYYRLREKDGTVVEVRVAANHSIALGAISRIAELRMTEVSFLQAMNLMPKALGVVKVEFDAKAMMRGFHQVLERYVPVKQRDEAKADLVATLRPSLAALEPAKSE